MELLGILVLSYLAIATVILFRNRFDLLPLENLPANSIKSDENRLSIEICIPARNEENTIRRAVQSVLQQDYPHLHLTVLDDESSDRTPQILAEIQALNPQKVTVIRGKPKPEGWLGKNWACRQMSQQTNADWLLFMDADVWLQKHTLSHLAQNIKRYGLHGATVWPKQHLYTFWEKVLIPLMYYALFSILPANYVYRAPRWMPAFIRKQYAPAFSAACGQFLAFERKAYESIGGHERVNDQVVEDVELARALKMKGFRIRMFHGGMTVHCRMYEGEPEIRQGFRKNFLAGFGNSLLLFAASAMLHLAVYVLPFMLLPLLQFYPFSPFTGIWVPVSVLAVLAHRFWLSRWYGWDYWPALFHPLAVLWYQFLGLLALRDYFSAKPVEWKGRSL